MTVLVVCRPYSRPEFTAPFALAPPMERFLTLQQRVGGRDRDRTRRPQNRWYEIRDQATFLVSVSRISHWIW